MLQGESLRGGESTRHFTPAWDGNPQGWRRYREEVRIWLLAEKVEGVEYSLAARLVQRLTGAARRAAMALSDEDLMGHPGIMKHRKGRNIPRPGHQIHAQACAVCSGGSKKP